MPDVACVVVIDHHLDALAAVVAAEEEARADAPVGHDGDFQFKIAKFSVGQQNAAIPGARWILFAGDRAILDAPDATGSVADPLRILMPSLQRFSVEQFDPVAGGRRGVGAGGEGMGFGQRRKRGGGRAEHGGGEQAGSDRGNGRVGQKASSSDKGWRLFGRWMGMRHSRRLLGVNAGEVSWCGPDRSLGTDRRGSINATRRVRAASKEFDPPPRFSRDSLLTCEAARLHYEQFQPLVRKVSRVPFRSFLR